MNFANPLRLECEPAEREAEGHLRNHIAAGLVNQKKQTDWAAAYRPGAVGRASITITLYIFNAYTLSLLDYDEYIQYNAFLERRRPYPSSGQPGPR